MTRVVLIGPPACGKTTQAGRLADHYGVPTLNTGDVLREEFATQTEIGRAAKAILGAGNRVPDRMALDLIEGRLNQPEMERGFVLDDVPRTLVQGRMLHDLLDHAGLLLDAVFLIEVDLDTVTARMAAASASRRASMIARGEVPRSDDPPEAIRHRYRVYETQTLPLVGFYQKANLLTPIDGRQTVAETTQAMIATLG